MPKRPCAIAITDDDSTIISADKFGDVYSLPLIDLSQPIMTESLAQRSEPSLNYITPAANEFTVHSERNRRALENQRKQKYKCSQKSELDFNCELLLGHVSMLTDVKLIKVDGFNYMITSDRDEHIRVSRGIPQTHVIENYCLGHSEFVSRLCIPETRPTILIFSKTDLKDHVAAIRSKLSSESERNDSINSQMKIAVSGILHVSVSIESREFDLIVVTCESLPALFTFFLSPESKLQYSDTISTSGNILSMSITSDQKSISKSLLLSIDNFHKPGSSSDIRREQVLDIPPLWRYSFHGRNLKGLPLIKEFPDDKSFENMSKMTEKLSDLLYSTESLRKRTDEAHT